MTRYLALEDVLLIHDEMIARFGGKSGIRDQGGLEAAVARPQSGYDTDLIDQAAALFESLSQNHPFIDGNKRVAVSAAAVFLRINGYMLEFEDTAAYDWLMSLYESGGLTKAAVSRWLRKHGHWSK